MHQPDGLQLLEKGAWAWAFPGGRESPSLGGPDSCAPRADHINTFRAKQEHESGMGPGRMQEEPRPLPGVEMRLKSLQTHFPGERACRP